MATAVEHLEDSIECGYCLQQNDQLVDPRELPCSHVYCYPCLVGDFETSRIVKCGKCRAVFDVTLARLPSATTRQEDILLSCDACIVKGTTNHPAVSYCASCNRRMCTSHEEFHGEFHPSHKDVVNIAAYKQNVMKLGIRSCTTHEDKPLTMGCTTCLSALCAACMGGAKDCVDDMAHQPVHLEQIIKLLQNKGNDMKSAAYAKEEKLSGILKFSTKVLSEYELQTEEMIDLLHTTREEQLSEVRNKYDELEMELVENRKKSREQIIEFMEREIGVRITEMNTLLLLQDARFRDAHQVEIVDSFAYTTNEIKFFIDEELPSIILANQRKLKVNAECRAIGLTMVEDPDICINEKRLKEDNIMEVGVSGEEEERVFCHRAKLYRFDVPTKQWKERGVGEMTLLKHHRNGTVRVVLRREQVLSLVCNHLVEPDIELLPMATSKTAWCWFARDYSDITCDDVKIEQFAVRFKNIELAGEFKRKFEESKEFVRQAQERKALKAGVL